jgi:hypothetical protein
MLLEYGASESITTQQMPCQALYLNTMMQGAQMSKLQKAGMQGKGANAGRAVSATMFLL